jgi:hypothetical protein
MAIEPRVVDLPACSCCPCDDGVTKRTNPTVDFTLDSTACDTAELIPDLGTLRLTFGDLLVHACPSGPCPGLWWTGRQSGVFEIRPAASTTALLDGDIHGTFSTDADGGGCKFLHCEGFLVGRPTQTVRFVSWRSASCT